MAKQTLWSGVSRIHTFIYICVCLHPGISLSAIALFASVLGLYRLVWPKHVTRRDAQNFLYQTVLIVEDFHFDSDFRTLVRTFKSGEIRNSYYEV